MPGKFDQMNIKKSILGNCFLYADIERHILNELQYVYFLVVLGH